MKTTPLKFVEFMLEKFPFNFGDYINIRYKSRFIIYLGFEKLIILTESRLWFGETTNLLIS